MEIFRLSLSATRKLSFIPLFLSVLILLWPISTTAFQPDTQQNATINSSSSDTPYSETLTLLKAPRSWGKRIRKSSGEINYNFDNSGKMNFRITLKGLDKKHSYVLTINGKISHPSNALLPQKYGAEKYYDFKQITTDKEGNYDKEVTIHRLKPGDYDVKFFVKDPSSKWKPVLYSDFFIFSLK